MSELVIRTEPSSSRLIDALMSVSQAVTHSIIRTAWHTHTPVIVQDEPGNILRLDAKFLARQYGIDD